MVGLCMRGPLAALLLAGAAFTAPALAQTSLIEQAPLSQLDAWSVGALTASEGSLGDELWRGSDAAALGALFDRLPARMDGAAARRLARRALATGGAAPPTGDAMDAARKRFSALARLGLADDLAVMAGGAGRQAADPLIAQFGAQAELSRGQVQAACQRSRQADTAEPAPFHLRLWAFCAARAGERAAADLALALLRGPAPDDAWFRTALTGVGDGAPRPNLPARFDNSLNVVLSLSIGLRPAASPLSNASNLALATLARSENAEQPLRATAAIAALRRGAISPPEARRALAAIPATVTMGLSPTSLAVRASEAGPGSPDAATAIAAALRANTGPNDFVIASSILRPDIEALRTAPDAAGALAFARAALAARDLVLAERLIGALSTAPVDQAMLVRLQTALAVARNLLAPDLAQRRAEQAGPAGARGAARDIALLVALGAQSAGSATPSPAGGRAGEPGLMRALQDAAARGARGETALTAALLLAPGAHTLDAASLSAIVATLRTVGLDDAARDVVVEAILAGTPA